MPRAPSRLRDGGGRSGRLAEQPLIWLLPLALLLLVSYVYPAIDVVRFSFTDATLLNPEYEYTLQSYANVSANRDLPIILQNTFIFVVASVILQLVLGLLVAMALNRGAKRGLPGVTFIRIVILASWIVPGVSAGIVWQLMFNEASYGFLNGVLRMMGLSAGRLALRSRHRDLVGGARQCLARHRLQHDPALRRPGGHPGAASTRRRRSTARPRFGSSCT